MCKKSYQTSFIIFTDVVMSPEYRLLMVTASLAAIVFTMMSSADGRAVSSASGNADQEQPWWQRTANWGREQYQNVRSWGRDVAASSANTCATLGRVTGWGCDDPVTRAVWRYLNNNPRSCAEFCTNQGRNGGSCVAGNTDSSTWCPSGQRCNCY